MTPTFYKTNKLKSAAWYDHAVILGIRCKRAPYPLKGRRRGILGYCRDDRIVVAANNKFEFFVGWHEIGHAAPLALRTDASRVWSLEYEKYRIPEEEFADCVAELACIRFGHPIMERTEWRVRHVAMAHAKHLFEQLENMLDIQRASG